ncbi:hypothetical protein ABLE68_07165 [Nocardioides sp. CN2-186]|uniref:hypothetical protein n=1 Tax=Nocardioides tweenelious TaxID=3156607 RepID=UPI0032B564B8
MTTHPGESVQGWSYGAEWVRTPDGPVSLVVVDVLGADLVVLRKEDIETVTPVGGYNDRQAFLEAVSALMDQMRPGEPEEYVHLLTGDHETIQVTVKRETHPCAPPRQPTF